jgi:hypothetical protein
MSLSSSLSGACGPASEGARPFAGEAREAYLSRLLAVYYLRATIVEPDTEQRQAATMEDPRCLGQGQGRAPSACPPGGAESKPFDRNLQRLLAEVHSGVGAGAKRKAPCQDTSRLKAKALNQRSVSVAPASSEQRTYTPQSARTNTPPAAPPPPPANATAPPRPARCCRCPVLRASRP